VCSAWVMSVGEYHRLLNSYMIFADRDKELSIFISNEKVKQAFRKLTKNIAGQWQSFIFSWFVQCNIIDIHLNRANQLNTKCQELTCLPKRRNLLFVLEMRCNFQRWGERRVTAEMTLYAANLVEVLPS